MPRARKRSDTTIDCSTSRLRLSSAKALSSHASARAPCLTEGLQVSSWSAKPNVVGALQPSTSRL
eukprot:scaffold1503_cov250-Pinguiococcus_pyrenoidosus.AAC.23